MKIYLKNIVNQLRNFSTTLDKSSILIDKPWVLIDGNSEKQKLIFKNNNELILSLNGQVKHGKWDYFPEAKQLLIDRITDKILCNEKFIDKGILILEHDRTDGDIFILANINIIPDLDVLKYLKTIRYKKLRIIEVIVKGGRVIEVEPYTGRNEVTIGSHTTEDGYPIADGIYQLENGKVYYQLENGIIKNIFQKEKRYVTKNGEEIFIRQQCRYTINKGDLVLINENLINDGVINFNYFKLIIVKQGKIVKIEFKNGIIKTLNNFLDKILNLVENPNESDKCFNWYFGKVMLTIILLIILSFIVVYITSI
jgi:hypothetical protein